MNKSILVLLVLFFLTSFASAECNPKYECSSWSPCVDGLQSRVCDDKKCDRKDIVERQFCGEIAGCSPSIKCSPWSKCFYDDKTEDLLKGEIKFGGYKTRSCYDSSSCIESFQEEASCEETYDLNVERVRECGTNFLKISDTLSKKQIALINLDIPETKRLNVLFSESSQCLSCFNSIKESEEGGVDCGGSCKKDCQTEKDFPLRTISLSSWFLVLAFSALFVKEIIRKKENK